MISNKNNKNVAVFSKGIEKKAEIRTLLGVDQFLFKPNDSRDIDFVVGWGKKPNTKAAKDFAESHQLDYFSLEDGFLHSTGQGVLGDRSCSLVKDSAGIYYDATMDSDLENLLTNTSTELFDDVSIDRAQKAIHRISGSCISKYNNGALDFDSSLLSDKHKVLVVDQTAGDMSLKYGYVEDSTFTYMLEAALDENPDSQIIVKTHPDVIADKKRGNINLKNLGERVLLISELINPIILLKKIDVVYVATSQMGFEALMLGKPVISFGVPFYAGWGLTDDRADKNLAVWKRRNQRRSLEELFVAAYIHYTLYLNPISKEPCELEDVLSFFENHYKKLELRDKVYCFNFTPWKQNYIKQFLQDESKTIFVKNAEDVTKKGFDNHSQLITWASKDQSEVEKVVERWGDVPWYLEDGFIRSTGLGTDLTAPASIVLDKTGIYYDPNQVSDLETLLETKNFEDEELTRASSLIQSLLKNELSKYNLGKPFDQSKLSVKQNQKIILIPGQVEDDASIKKGCVDIKTNSDLIQSVKEKNREAFLIYKPHPDVVSGNRKGKVEQSITNKYCDLVLHDASITDCLEVVDEVHTMTSLVGFEALLRDLKVVCYGLPFYAGWGLTEDFHKVERRTRKLNLNELVHATLIDYPLYMDWETSTLTTPEVVVEQLRQQIEDQGGKQSNQVSSIRRLIRKINNFIKGVFYS